MTSKGLNEAINTWLKAYEPYFTSASAPVAEEPAEDAANETTVEE